MSGNLDFKLHPMTGDFPGCQHRKICDNHGFSRFAAARGRLRSFVSDFLPNSSVKGEAVVLPVDETCQIGSVFAQAKKSCESPNEASQLTAQ